MNLVKTNYTYRKICANLYKFFTKNLKTAESIEIQRFSLFPQLLFLKRFHKPKCCNFATRCFFATSLRCISATFFTSHHFVAFLQLVAILHHPHTSLCNFRYKALLWIPSFSAASPIRPPHCSSVLSMYQRSAKVTNSFRSEATSIP